MFNTLIRSILFKYSRNNMLLETIMKRLKKTKGMPNPETCSKCKKEVFCYFTNIYFKKWCKITCFECYNKKEKARIKYKGF